MPARVTTEQQRAKNAHEHVESMAGENAGVRKAYAAQARGLPAMIQQNGLGQTLAFMSAKAGGTGDLAAAYRALNGHLGGFVLGRVRPEGSGGELLAWIISQNTAVYRQATNEALAYALWLRRFAEAQGWGREEGQADEQTPAAP